MVGLGGFEPPTYGLGIRCEKFSTVQIIEFKGPLNPTCVTDKALFALICDANCDAVFLLLFFNSRQKPSQQSVPPGLDQVGHPTREPWKRQHNSRTKALRFRSVKVSNSTSSRLRTDSRNGRRAIPSVAKTFT